MFFDIGIVVLRLQRHVQPYILRMIFHVPFSLHSYCHTLSMLFGDPQDQDIEEVFVQGSDTPSQYGVAVFRIDKLKLP